MKIYLLNGILLFLCLNSFAQSNDVSKAWRPDNGSGTYKNPVIHADYSDPDAIRVGDDYYMIASSFNASPGLPILHSKDLVNWKIIGHALTLQPPVDHFSKVRHGEGVWAPAIRYHKNEFYIYYPDPDFGIYVIKAKTITGPWSEPVLVEGGKGLIDPCPLWDDNGKVYLVHALAGSRAGVKSIIIMKELNAEGTQVTGEAVMVYDGHDTDPTIEGPKLYKKNGYYYIFAPAGGVSTGWQLALRSKNIYGPYERKVVMDQGTTPVNGPHQGAWVTTKTGEDWFLHFQDKGAYGRVVHLQPMQWKNDWPVIGADTDGDGKGEPVLVYKKPDVGGSHTAVTPKETDEFTETTLGKQWQWQANPQQNWAFPAPNGTLRLFSVKMDSTANYYTVPNLLMQKFPAEAFSAVTKIVFKPRHDHEKLGLIVLGSDYAHLSLVKRKEGTYITYNTCLEADKGKAGTEEQVAKIVSDTVYLKVTVAKNAVCSFSYSADGKSFQPVNKTFTAKPGRWVGAKVGLFCTRVNTTNDAGFADVDWFRVEE